MQHKLRRLAKKLDRSDADALRKDQERWLAQRATLPESDRIFFTRLRIAHLHACSEYQ